MWTDSLLKRINRRRIEITYDPHALLRESQRNLDLDLVEETVRSGRVDPKRSEPPGKVCFKRYFGKQNQTYTVIVIVHDYYVEVRTSWKERGR